MTRVYKKRPDNCLGCGEPIRPRHRQDMPGKSHAGNGDCDRCHNLRRRGIDPATRTATDEITPEQIAHTRAGLINYINRRRARRVPPEGLAA